MTLPKLRLRVAFVAGTLGRGGAEKQLFYMARELHRLGASVQVLALTRGEPYEVQLRDAGIPVRWFGRAAHPAARTLALALCLCRWRPQVLQSSHFFTNLYARLVAPLCGAVDVGAMRSDGVYDLQANGWWGPHLLRTPRALVANSHTAARVARELGVPPRRVTVLHNVIELDDWPVPAREAERGTGEVCLVAIARLVPAKRLDYFIRAVARARHAGARVVGRIVGGGPERQFLEQVAASERLGPPALEFTGECADIRPALERSHILLHPADHEGFPNVLLEAMAAGLPVIATRAGDVTEVVEQGVTGFIVECGDIDAMVDHIIRLSCDPATRQQLGRAGRARVERLFSAATLGERLLALYERIGEVERRPRLLAALRQPPSPKGGRHA